MNRRFLLSLVSCLALVSSASAEKLKVLIVDGQNNHQWAITTPVLVNALESSDAFTVTVSTSPAKDAPKEAWDAWRPKFGDFAAVVSNYNGTDWPEAVQKDFESYVQNGGGFVGRSQQHRVTGHGDHADTSLMQPVDQAVGHLTLEI